MLRNESISPKCSERNISQHCKQTANQSNLEIIPTIQARIEMLQKSGLNSELNSGTSANEKDERKDGLI